jgi:hypothetical protein
MSESTGGSAEDSSPDFPGFQFWQKTTLKFQVIPRDVEGARMLMFHVKRRFIIRYRTRHTLEQSPCYAIIAKNKDTFIAKLHFDIKNVHLESIEHPIKYKDPAAHKSELLKCPQITHE